MNRQFLGAMILCAAVAGLAQADYLRITYIPGVAKGGTGSAPVAPGGAPKAGAPAQQFDYTKIRADVIVEYKLDKEGQDYHSKHLRPLDYQHGYDLIKHFRWGPGWTNIPKVNAADSETSKDIKFTRVTDPTGASQGRQQRHIPLIQDQYKKKHGEAKSADDHLELAHWALDHGLVEECGKNLAQFAKLKPTDAIAKAYVQVEKNLKTPLPEDKNVAFWKASVPVCKVYDPKDDLSPDFTLLHNFDTESEVMRLAHSLENQYRGILYSFALHGEVLPRPQARFMVALIKEPKDFYEFHKHFDEFIYEDGFYDRRDNLLVLSATPLNDAYLNLAEATRPIWLKMSKQEMLEGKRILPHQAKWDDVVQLSKNQVSALLLTALKDDSERATYTNLHSRQLATSVGLLPSHVHVPEWIEFATGSLYETPRAAYWPSVGGPDWHYILKFWVWLNDSKNPLRAHPAESLAYTVSDHGFREARATHDPAALLRCSLCRGPRLLSGHEHRDGLMRYYHMLGELPRDLKFDDEANMRCFASLRSHGCEETECHRQRKTIEFRRRLAPLHTGIATRPARYPATGQG